jgi:uncharacterized protein
MLDRPLIDGEIDLARRAETFVRENHRGQGGHDDSHVLAVTDYAIRIAERADEPADPFVVVMGALFHDLGRIGTDSGELHGLRGAALAREWLHSTGVEEEVRERILRVVARHTPTTRIAPDAVEERIVFDADALDRLGIMGMLRGLMGKRGSTEHIIEDRIQKRLGDYDRLHLDVSKRMGEALHRDTLTVVERFRRALEEEVRQLHRIPWPVEHGMDVPVPSLESAAVQATELEAVPDLAVAMAKVEVEAEIRQPWGSGNGAPPESAAPCSRTLTDRESALVEGVAELVHVNHAHLTAHDYAHVLTVVKNALRISATVDENVDPLVLLCGAFLHDVGWVGARSGAEHGLRGASVANEYLCSTWVSEKTRARIRRVVARHSMASGHAPRTAEERIVWDADGLAGVGLIGVLRGIISGVGSSGEIVEACLRYAGKRAHDLHFEESRRIAEELRDDARSLVERFTAALAERERRVERLRLPS